MNNVSITIDEKRNILKAMFHKDKALSVKEFDLSSMHEGIDYEKAFSIAFKSLISEGFSSLVYIIPDNYVACDYVEIPAIYSGKKLNDILNLEISNRFKQSDNFKISFVPMGESNHKAAFFAYLIPKDIIASIHSALKSYKFASRQVTFESAATVNAFLTLHPTRRRDNILFADVKSNYARLMMIKDNRLAGFSSFPINTNDSGAKFLIRILTQMCDTAEAQYRMENIALKLNAPKAYAALLDSSAKECGLQQIAIKDALIAEHLELFGGLNSKHLDKGLLY